MKKKERMFVGLRRTTALAILAIVAMSGTLWLAARYNAARKPPKPFHFPFQELADIDRDLQARFAVVPDKDFGIERTYGNQHYLYNPQTPTERATITALKREKTSVAFYLMSRALWMRSWDGWGYKPIQGPVLLTEKLQSPLPRRVNFNPLDNSSKQVIINQERASSADGNGQTIPMHNPAGTPVPELKPPPNAPSFNQLQLIGNRVFEMAENTPKTTKIGLNEKLNTRWRVVAVPIRASSQACLSCHVYSPLPTNPNASRRTTVEIGDALGVAFYLFDRPLSMPKKTPTPKPTH